MKPGDNENEDGDIFCLELLYEMIKKMVDQIEYVEIVTEETEGYKAAPPHSLMVTLRCVLCAFGRT